MKKLNLAGRSLSAPMKMHRGPSARLHISTRTSSLKRGSYVGTAYGGASNSGKATLGSYTSGLRNALKFNTGF